MNYMLGVAIGLLWVLFFIYRHFTAKEIERYENMADMYCDAYNKLFKEYSDALDDWISKEEERQETMKQALKIIDEKLDAQ